MKLAHLQKMFLINAKRQKESCADPDGLKHLCQSHISACEQLAGALGVYSCINLA